MRGSGAAGERHVLRERHEDVRGRQVRALGVRAHRLGGVHSERARPARESARRPLGRAARARGVQPLLRARLPSAALYSLLIVVLLVLRHVSLVGGRRLGRGARARVREALPAAARQHLRRSQDAAVAQVRLPPLRRPLPARYAITLRLRIDRD